MYFRVMLKHKIFNYKFGWILLLGVTLSGLLLFFRSNSRSFTEYTVSFLDEDRTELSKKLLESLKTENKLLIREKSDIVYVVRKGYAEGFQKGDLSQGIGIKRYNNADALGIMNDIVANTVINQFVYYDLYERLNQVKKMDYEAYVDELKKTEKENIILSLNSIYFQSEPQGNLPKNGYELYLKYVHILLIAFVGMSIHLSSFSNLCRSKEEGLRQRLHFVKISDAQLIATDFVINHIYLFSFLLCFITLSKDLDWKTFLLSMGLIEMSFFSFFFLEKYSRDSVSFRISATFLMIIFVGIGVFLQYLR